jgi:hypothetical protein
MWFIDTELSWSRITFGARLVVTKKRSSPETWACADRASPKANAIMASTRMGVVICIVLISPPLW